MKAIRNLGDSLVERRLWPVALLLVAALVAVPVALSSNAPTVRVRGEVSAAALTPEPVLAPPNANVVAAIGSGRGLTALARRNPFMQRTVKVSHTTTTSSTPPASSSSSTSSPSSTSTSTTPGTGGSGSTTTSPGPAITSPAPPKTYVTVSVDLSFGRIGHSVRHRHLARLSALPSAAHPVVIYLGVVSHAKTAVFLISSDVHAEGDGRCFPSTRSCQTVHVPLGGTEFFDVFSASGSSRQYELDLTTVAYHRTTSKAKAARSFLRVARGGAKALRAFSARLGLRYNRSTGRLVPAKPAKKAHARTGSGSAQTSTGAGDGSSAGPSAAPPSSLGSLRDHNAPSTGGTTTTP
jgi:hypothetical protein